MRWVIRKDISFEGISEYYCNSEQEVLEYLHWQNPAGLDEITIEPEALVSYSPSEFKERYVN